MQDRRAVARAVNRDEHAVSTRTHGQCARVFTAARAVMTADQLGQYLRDNDGIVRTMQAALPWQGRLRAMLRKPLRQDPRVALRSALEEAALS